MMPLHLTQGKASSGRRECGMHSGIAAAAAAYIWWGLFPLYVKQVQQAAALEVVLHRALWSALFMALLLTAWRRWAWLPAALRSRRTMGVFALSTLLVSVNWLLYVWAVNAHRVLDASLGYFINPLLNVALGYFVLHERPRPWQWAAVGLAAGGVLWLTVAAGGLPWVSLALAGSFGLYGLLRKTAPLGPAEGLALETLLLAAVGLPALWWFGPQLGHAFAEGDWALRLWLVAAGPITAVPLLLFAYGARRIPLATLGLLQYLGPSIQFALGVWLYHEPFSATRAVGFGFIWAALALYSAEGLLLMRRRALA
jgi:chloramphenicol-sensitive protein RarD